MQKQIMVYLPTTIVRMSLTGKDYAGPLEIKVSKLRNAKSHKTYIAIFVLFAVKVIHLERFTWYASAFLFISPIYI